MNHDDVIAVLNKPLSLELMNSDVHARIAYNGSDGFPRVIPVAYVWNGQEIVFCSPPNATKVRSLQKDPKVAITIDTDDFPPKLLLIRGTAAIEIVDGIPDEFIEGARRQVPAEGFAEWEAGSRALYDQMARIVVTPVWAKLIDFETTLPSAVAELIDAKGFSAQPQS
jgi:hypothetical protein